MMVRNRIYNLTKAENCVPLPEKRKKFSEIGILTVSLESRLSQDPLESVSTVVLRSMRLQTWLASITIVFKSAIRRRKACHIGEEQKRNLLYLLLRNLSQKTLQSVLSFKMLFM